MSPKCLLIQFNFVFWPLQCNPTQLTCWASGMTSMTTSWWSNILSKRHLNTLVAAVWKTTWSCHLQFVGPVTSRSLIVIGSLIVDHSVISERQSRLSCTRNGQPVEHESQSFSNKFYLKPCQHDVISLKEDHATFCILMVSLYVSHLISSSIVEYSTVHYRSTTVWKKKHWTWLTRALRGAPETGGKPRLRLFERIFL